jgi:uncharacterized membrane protein
LAIVIGVLSLRYALPTPLFPAEIPNYSLQRTAVIVHASSASLALLFGPWQFLAGFRKRSLMAHRLVGYVYIAAVIVGWLSSLFLIKHADYGIVSSGGFLFLGLAWIFTTLMGLFTVIRKRVASHRQWMIRSYALTTSAITLRLYLLISVGMGLDFSIAYPAIAWLCWIPNWLVAELLFLRNIKSNQ